LKKNLNTHRILALQRLVVCFLAAAFLAPTAWGLFGERPSVYAKSNDFSAHLHSSVEAAHRHSFPMDEQQAGNGELEIVFETGSEGLEEYGLEARPRSFDLNIKSCGGLFALGLWTRIGEKNQGVPPALYLRHHALRIPS
jgi:hypothetical protein